MQFRKEIDNNKEIIQRFDELICDKASKFDLELTKQSIVSKLINHCLIGAFGGANSNYF